MIQEFSKESISKCVTGDVKEFKKLYQHYSIPLYHIAFRFLGNKHEAENAVQQCMINVYKNLSQFKAKSKFTSWIFRILFNVCYDILSKREKIITVDLQEEIVDYSDFKENSDKELSIELKIAINRLPDKMRSCFILSGVEGFKQREIAEMLDIREGTVKATLFKARIKLRDYLREVI